VGGEGGEGNRVVWLSHGTGVKNAGGRNWKGFQELGKECKNEDKFKGAENTGKLVTDEVQSRQGPCNGVIGRLGRTYGEKRKGRVSNTGLAVAGVQSLLVRKGKTRVRDVEKGGHKRAHRLLGEGRWWGGKFTLQSSCEGGQAERIWKN